MCSSVNLNPLILFATLRKDFNRARYRLYYSFFKAPRITTLVQFQLLKYSTTSPGNDIHQFCRDDQMKAISWLNFSVLSRDGHSMITIKPFPIYVMQKNFEFLVVASNISRFSVLIKWLGSSSSEIDALNQSKSDPKNICNFSCRAKPLIPHKAIISIR